MKIWTSEHVFDHPWSTVTAAAWRKYPNPINPVVSGMDIVKRTVGTDGVLKTTRLLQTQWRIPGWATKLIGLENPSLALEYSEVDPTAKTMTLRSRNITCSYFVTVDETLVYRTHPDNPNKTILEQSAVITVAGVPLIDRMESIVESSINTNAHKGRSALEWVINSIKAEYDELTTKLSSEYQDVTQKLVGDYNELTRRGFAELRKFGLEEVNFSAAPVPEASLSGSGS